ncbi:MAG: ketol-acid reductoisomerase, partial [Candidatus Eisenbacteria bacterium]|nr:ketol-acid reductoisomerase [Candidatus Eisenbacteria bacterium]
MSSRPVGWLDAAAADARALDDLRIVVIGYGNQGRAQARNLRDSRIGRSIAVWTRPDGPSQRQARADGFPTIDPEALAQGDLFLCLLPDEAIPAFVQHELAPRLWRADRPGRIGFAHGFALAFTPLGEALRQEPWREVFLLAPSGPGSEVRAAYTAGGGVAALLAIWHDADGRARAHALALAHGLGASRAGVFETTVREETIVDLFGEQAVVCGGLTALLESAFATLVAAGYPAEMAYLECVHQMRLTADLVHRHGIAGMRERISGTARFGERTRGPRIAAAGLRAVQRQILAEIESGAFAREWLRRAD